MSGAITSNPLPNKPNKMNRENLQRMADHIRTVPQEKFDMDVYRDNDSLSHECNTVGCVIGHCTVLDKEPLPPLSYICIDFTVWSERFTGIDSVADAWHWCFSSHWSHVDNTPTGAALRIEWLLNNGLPENWDEQMNGQEPLCYLNDK